MGLLELTQGTDLGQQLYLMCHGLSVVSSLGFGAWYGRKYGFSLRKSLLMTALFYGSVYCWMLIQLWIESGFREFGGRNIVHTFVYIPLIAWGVAKLFKARWAVICDFIPPIVCMAVAVACVGCIFAGCCYGYPCSWGIYNHRYQGSAFPVQIFEILTVVVIFVIMLMLNKKTGYRGSGTTYPTMLVLYGSTRFLWEFARNNEKLILGCSAESFHAIFMVIVGAEMLFTLWEREKKKAQKLENHIRNPKKVRSRRK